MKTEKKLLMNVIIRDLGYTGRGDRQSSRETLSLIILPKLVDDIQKKLLMKIQTTLMIYKEKE